jgi:hypothetical protein
MNAEAAPLGLSQIFFQLGKALNEGQSPLEHLQFLTAQLPTARQNPLLAPFLQALDSGATLAEAAETHPEITPRQAYLIRIGAALDCLPLVFDKLGAEQLEKDRENERNTPTLSLNPISMRFMALTTFLCLFPGFKTFIHMSGLHFLLGAEKFVQAFAIGLYLFHCWQRRGRKPNEPEADLVQVFANLGLIAVGGFLVFCGLVSLIIPQFQEIFAGMGLNLPSTTKFVWVLSDLLCTLGFPAAFPVFLGLALYGRNRFLSASGQKAFLRWGKKIPLLRLLVGALHRLRSWETLAKCVEWGTPFLRAVEAEARINPHEPLPLPGYLQETLASQSLVPEESIIGAIRSEKSQLTGKLERASTGLEILCIAWFCVLNVLLVHATFFSRGLCHCVH